MKQRTTETISDGMRTIGSIVPKENDFEVFDGEGAYLFKAPSLSEARVALRRHDLDRAAMARLEDDGAPT